MAIAREPFEILSERMVKTGFPVQPSGMCYGFAGTGMQALLTGNIKLWLLRNILIKQTPLENFKLDCEDLYPDHPEISIEVAAFFTAIVGYQFCATIPRIITNEAVIFGGMQCIKTSSELVGSIELEAMGGFHKLDTIINIYDQNTLINYLNKIKELYLTLKKPFCLGILMQSTSHAATLGYDISNDTWYFIEINSDLETECSTTDIAIVANWIVSQFSLNGYAVLHFTFTTCGKLAEFVEPIFKQWFAINSMIDINQAVATYHDSNGATLLHLACEWNHEILTEQLLKAGANPLQSVNGISPLHFISIHGNALLAKRLLRCNAANINQVAPWAGRTALINAAACGHTEYVRLLLLYGADTSIKDMNQKTAYDLAANSEIRALIKLHRRIQFKPFKNSANLFNIHPARENITSLHEKERPSKRIRLE